MGLVLRLVETRADGETCSTDVLEFSRPGDLRDIANLGLMLPEAKQLLARVQQAVVAAQARDHAALRPECLSCGARCHVKDWQSRQVATLFGRVAVRLPRFRCPGCGRNETGVSWPSHCRSTPELDQLPAHLLPVAATTSHETLRGRTLAIGEQLRDAATAKGTAATVAAPPAPVLTVSLDSTFIRSCQEGERHLEVRVGNVETPAGGRQVFGAVATAGTSITGMRGILCSRIR